MNDKIKDVVEQVLKYNPDARNNDFGLVMRVYIKMGFAKKTKKGILIGFMNIEDAPSFETITRIRREIQNTENRLRADEEVEEKREEHRKEVSSRYSPRNINEPIMANNWMC